MSFFGSDGTFAGAGGAPAGTDVFGGAEASLDGKTVAEPVAGGAVDDSCGAVGIRGLEGSGAPREPDNDHHVKKITLSTPAAPAIHLPGTFGWL